TVPFWPARMMAGSASAMAACAAVRLPVAMASSTLRTALRRRERRALLITVRRAIWRAAFLADFVLAMLIEPAASFEWTERVRRRCKRLAAYARLIGGARSGVNAPSWLGKRAVRRPAGRARPRSRRSPWRGRRRRTRRAAAPRGSTRHRRGYGRAAP